MMPHPRALACLPALFLSIAAQAADSGASTTTTRSTSRNGSSWSASSSTDPNDPRDIARRVPVMPLAQAGTIALKRVPGTLLDAEIETNDGIRTWQIDIQAKDGHRVRMWLNASTGDFLKMADR